MKASATEVSNEIIRVAHKTGKSISNMKLQKLLYLAQGIHLAINNDTPLFEDSINAWKYGPVVPSVHHKFKIYFSGEIPADHPFLTENNPLGESEKKLIGHVVELYGDLSAISLSNFTRLPDSPWSPVYNGFAGDFDPSVNPSSEITTSSISIYFKTKVLRFSPEPGRLEPATTQAKRASERQRTVSDAATIALKGMA